MSGFEAEGKKYWEKFGKSFELSPRQYFDFVSEEEYENILEKHDFSNKKVVDIGAGFPPPLQESFDKKFTPLASGLQEILEKKGAKIIPVDISLEALKAQMEMERESVATSSFQLPLKDDSISGGAVILNLFNSSYAGEGERETYIKPEECEKILQEIYRVLQKNSFVIINNYGYTTVILDNTYKLIGPEKADIITPEMIQELAQKVGFKHKQLIDLDPEREKLGESFALESFPEALREQLSIKISNGGALFIEK